MFISKIKHFLTSRRVSLDYLCVSIMPTNCDEAIYLTLHCGKNIWLLCIREKVEKFKADSLRATHSVSVMKP